MQKYSKYTIQYLNENTARDAPRTIKTFLGSSTKLWGIAGAPYTARLNRQIAELISRGKVKEVVSVKGGKAHVWITD